jgi:hypothetical protein
MSSYETVIKRDLVAPQGNITGKILLIVPSYGNKRKSLDALAKKLKASCDSVNFKEVIPSLRAEILSKRQEEIAAALADGDPHDELKPVTK